MTRYRTLDHPMIASIAWDPARPAEKIAPDIYMVHATSNSYLIASDEGDVVINTATAQQGARTREKFEEILGRPLNVAKIIYTQSHPDHIGGWEFFAGPQSETIVQREFQRICDERKLLGPFFGPRNLRVLSALVPPGQSVDFWFTARDPENLTTFADDYAFTLGGRRYEVFTLSSGETLDALGVWLPEEKTLFFGNWAGALYGAFPNFYTARGDRDRSVTEWLKHARQMIALNAEMLVTGHDQPTVGADAVRADLTKLHDAVQYVHDETVKGMNAHKDLATLMREIELPPHLTPNAGRGLTSWYVRTVWEEYAGWFHHDSTTELYGVPPAAIWPELAEMAGGADALVARARARFDKGETIEALHFLEIAQAAAPDSRAVLEALLNVYSRLADDSEGKVFDLLGWLEGKIAGTKAALGAQ